jgi:hypothetical protein
LFDAGKNLKIIYNRHINFLLNYLSLLSISNVITHTHTHYHLLLFSFFMTRHPYAQHYEHIMFTCSLSQPFSFFSITNIQIMIPNCSFTTILIFIIQEISLFNCPLIKVPIAFINEVNFLNRLLTRTLILLTKELVFSNFSLNRAVIPLTKELVFSNCLLNKALIPLIRELVSQIYSCFHSQL